MALKQVDTFTVSTAVASVTLGGGSSGSSGNNFAINTDDVYMATIVGWYGTGSIPTFNYRLTKSGSADTTSNYDYLQKRLRTDAVYNNNAVTNGNMWQISGVLGHSSGTQRPVNQIFYLYDFNSANYSFVSYSSSNWYGHTTNSLVGTFGTAVHTVGTSSDGLQFFMSTGDIGVGSQFTLYKVV